jgi:uncharacterized protein YraI
MPLLRANILITAALGALICVFFAQNAPGEADGPDWFKVVDVAADDVLNVRAEPSAGADKLGAIPPGADCVRNLGCQGGLTFGEFTTLTPEQQAARLKDNPRWCKVDYRGTIGWVAGRYLAEGGCEQ